MGKLLAWIEAFLTNRSQRVVVGGCHSDWAPVTSGVPQGSVLGPLLFLVFINDLPDAISCPMKVFADDTKICNQVSLDTSIEALQSDIDAAVKWSDKWQLPFNEGKCKVLHVGSANQGHTYQMRGTPLEHLLQEKDLGIKIDTELKFHKQATSAVSKASQMLAVIRRSFVKIDATTLPLLYKSLVRTHLEYGNIIWGPFNREDQKKVERVQRRATRLVKDIRHLPYPDRLKILKLPSLYYRRKRGDMIQVFQLLHGGVDMNPDKFLTPAVDGRTRGHPWKLNKPRAVTRVRRNAFSTRIVNEWNALPAAVVGAVSINQFKSRLDKHWESISYAIPIQD